MIDYLEKLKKLNNNDENIRAITEIEDALNEKKYGLVWEEHSEKVDEMLEHHIPVFIEDKKRKITADENEPYNFLLEGDNFHSLKLLQKTHKGKIDVIYIDPPYNTGNKDFIYDDHFIDKTDGYAHSKWLSFMEKRLLIAKELLSDEGVIFISIDDNEQAQLKLLCDSILGEENFIAKISVASNSAKNNSKFISITHEYIICYAKNKSVTLPYWKVNKNNINEYNKICKRLQKSGLTNEEIHQELLQLVKYPKYYDFDHYTYVDEIGPFRASDLTAPGSKAEYDVVHPITKKKCKLGTRGWAFKELEMKRLIAEGYIYFGKNEDVMPQLKNYLSENEKSLAKSIIFFDSQASTKWLKKQKIEFPFPKALDLIKYIISMYPSKDIAILDFFAGSGTTGHAVMQLNKEDGGHRKYILCTNNENNICEEVTYQRLKNIQEELPHNLKYYKTEFIPKFSDDEDSISEKMMEHIRELIELEYAIELDGKKYIILDDEDGLDEAISKIENDGKLFIRSGIFLSRSNQRILEEKGVGIIEIPEYYFREELKEVGEL